MTRPEIELRSPGSLANILPTRPMSRYFNSVQINEEHWIKTLLENIQPLHSSRIWHKVNFKRSLTGLNSEFSYSWNSCLTTAEEPSLPYYSPIGRRRIIGFLPFPRVLVLCEMQSVSSRIWTRIAVFISCHDNHYTTGTLLKLFSCVNKFSYHICPTPPIGQDMTQGQFLSGV